MSYFKFPCLQAGPSKTVGLILSVALIVLGVIHIAYGAVVANVKALALDAYPTLDPKSLDHTWSSPGSFHIIAGGIAIVGSLISLLSGIQVLGKDNRNYWFKLLITVLGVVLAVQFAIAVYTTLAYQAYLDVYKTQMAQTFRDTVKAMADSPAKRYGVGLLAAIDFTLAQAIISFALGVPAALLTLVSVAGAGFDANPQIKPEQHSTQNIAN